ncbi:hypothetical protein Cgig2_022975 [Carnegiea gigantea]|uniref:Uncharacterized protein n=1 Tax=Carnegiea gigantea TaxID=171969 RepID=A0A9Q1JU05_9CARY|nr:hypothetical protein Cgig2_022975 [Carnegiea gigantea]
MVRGEDFDDTTATRVRFMDLWLLKCKGEPKQPAKADQIMEYDPTKLRIRMSPYGLCSFLPSISDEQKRDIIELRFEFLLTLRVDKIPSRLAKLLVENFDTCRRAVKLASNDELRIIEEDIYLTMGFPRGSTPVQEAKKSDKGEYTWVLDEWKDQWRGVLPKTQQVLAQMKNQRQESDLFKRNFIVYVVSTLIKGKQTWKLCYVDCVMYKKRKIGREFPILANWTSKDLWTRMNFELESYQGFGKGIENDVIKASEIPTVYIQEEEVDVRAKKACVQKISRSLKNFAHSVIEVVDVVSEAQQMFPASTLMDKVQGVLVEILTNYSKLGTFKDATGPSQTQPRDANVGHQATPSSQDDDACVEFAKTYEKTSGIACRRTFKPPGFDLGFGFRLSQSVQVESPNQAGSGGVEGIGSGSRSSPDSHKQRSPDLGSESSGEDSVGDCLPPRKKMPASHFRSPFFDNYK